MKLLLVVALASAALLTSCTGAEENGGPRCGGLDASVDARDGAARPDPCDAAAPGAGGADASCCGTGGRPSTGGTDAGSGGVDASSGSGGRGTGGAPTGGSAGLGSGGRGSGGAASGGAPQGNGGRQGAGGRVGSGGQGSGGRVAGNGGAPGAGGRLASGGAPGNGGSGAGGRVAGNGGRQGSGGACSSSYQGPTVGSAKEFGALAYAAVTAANPTTITGAIGTSAQALSYITGFDGPGFVKYGLDSPVPGDQVAGLAQGDVTILVGQINPLPCDWDMTNVVGGLTGDVTLKPGVTCFNSFAADIPFNGIVRLDAECDENAHFIIRGNRAMTVANGSQVILENGAQACGVFWRIAAEVVIGTTVQMVGTVISGSAITMQSYATLEGRLLAQTEAISFDFNAVTVPTDASCPHVQ